MKINWTPETPHVERPKHPHTKISWTLWMLAIASVSMWVAGMAAGVDFDGKINLLLVAFAVLMLVCVICGFKYVEYLVPMKLARDWVLSLRASRAGRHIPHG